MPNDPVDTTKKSISDDQELAKVLAGISQETAPVEEPVVTTPVPTPAPTAEDASSLPQPADEVSPLPEPTTDPAPAPVEEPVASVPTPAPTSGLSSDLNSVKAEALSELRPLVDKLEVSPEEKFDTYLLLLRSTDDKDLIAPAHDAAKNIPDESRRAQALLDIIKEIDFLSQNQQ